MRTADCLLECRLLSYMKLTGAVKAQDEAAMAAGWCRAGMRRTILFLSYSTTRRPAGSVGSEARSTGMKLCSSSVLYPDCAHTSPVILHHTQGMHSSPALKSNRRQRSQSIAWCAMLCEATD